MKLYTSQYRYRGIDRLDITVAGNDPVGSYFAPTMSLVLGIKDGSCSQETYITQYDYILRSSLTLNPGIWTALLALDSIVLVCFCKAGSFCHRYLLADFLVQLGATYCGEVEP